MKPVQVEALKNYPNLSNVTQFSVISIMNDALPKKSKESKLSFSAKKLDKYFPPQYSTKERENIIIQLLEQWSADQVQSEYGAQSQQFAFYRIPKVMFQFKYCSLVLIHCHDDRCIIGLSGLL